MDQINSSQKFTMQDKSSPKFSERLRYAMQLSGVKASKMSEESGVSKGYISGFLSEKKPIPSIEIIHKLSKVLECSPLWLIGNGENYANYEQVMIRRKELEIGRTNSDDWKRIVTQFSKELNKDQMVKLIELIVKEKPKKWEDVHTGLLTLLKDK